MAFKVTRVCSLMFEFQTRRFLEGLVRAFATCYFYRILDAALLWCSESRSEDSEAKVELKFLRYPDISLYLTFSFVDAIL